MSENQLTRPGDLSRLRDLEFNDLFFSEDGEAFFRGLAVADDDSDRGPLADIPDDVVVDLERLHRQVCERGHSAVDTFQMQYDGMHFRVQPTPTVDGRWYMLRRAIYPLPRIGALGGIPARVIQYLGHLGRPGKHGLILVCGGIGEGKSTTAGALLQEYLIHYGDVGVTVEDPVELPLNGVHGKFGRCFQTPVINGDFAAAMEATVRRSPRYILIGEIRRSSEAATAIRAAHNGHLVIATIHAGSPVEAINALLLMASASESLDLVRGILADGLAGVMYQRLIRPPGKKGKVQVKLEYLFPGDDKGIRTLIRQGKTEQLATAMASQASRVMQGKLPIGD